MINKDSYTEHVLDVRHCTRILSNSHNNPGKLVLFSPILLIRKLKLRKLPEVLELENKQI